MPFKAPPKAYFDFVSGDGFMVSPIYSPGAIEFVDLLVPGLHGAGGFGGSTLG